MASIASDDALIPPHRANPRGWDFRERQVRTKDLVKVKGMLINPAVLLDTLQSIAGIDEFQVVVRRENSADLLSMDELVVRVASSIDQASLTDTIVAKTRDAVRVRPKIEFVDAQDIYDARRQTKATRFVDQRA